MLYNLSLNIGNPSTDFTKYMYNFKRFDDFIDTLNNMCNPLDIHKQFKQVFTSYDTSYKRGYYYLDFYNITLNDFYNLKRLLDFKQ